MAKRFLISVFVILFCDLIYAKNYDLSRIDLCKTVTEYSEDTTVEQMDTVTFGSYPQSDASGNYKEPIEWIVLEKQGDKAFLLSKYILDCKRYNETNHNITWENCTLRYWLNNAFLNIAFNSNEQSQIVITNVINSNNSHYGTSGGNNTNDKLFCLSFDEVKKYYNLPHYNTNDSRLATRGTNLVKSKLNGNIVVVDDNDYDISNDWYSGNCNFGCARLVNIRMLLHLSLVAEEFMRGVTMLTVIVFVFVRPFGLTHHHLNLKTMCCREILALQIHQIPQTKHLLRTAGLANHIIEVVHLYVMIG